MSSDELYDMFGLDAELPPEPEACDSVSHPPETVRHPNVVKMDEWGKRRGRELADCPRWKATDLTAECAQDFHALAFNPTPELQPCTATYREEFIRAMVDTPEYKALHEKTQLDDFGSQIAALEMGDKFAEFRNKLAQETTAAEREGREAPKPGSNPVASLVAAASAVSAAMKEVEAAEEAAQAFGMGDGAAGERLDAKKLAEVFQRVRGNPKLRRICEMAGRFRRVAQSKQRMKASHGQDEIVGVELGGEIGRIIPAELVKLDVPELEMDMLRRIAERQAMCREMSATEPAGKGPIVVVVDESGSMKGEKEDAAKAMALALAWIARKQKRWCVLVGFSGSESGNKLVLKPGQNDEAALMDWLSHFYGRGTDMDVPLVELPKWWPEFIAQGLVPGATDIIMFTDAVCHVSLETFVSFTTWKAANQVKLTSVIIGDRAGDLLRVSDECHEVSGINTGCPVVGSILSL